MRGRVLFGAAIALVALALAARSAPAQDASDLRPVAVDVSHYPQVSMTFDVPDRPAGAWTATVLENGAARPVDVQAGTNGRIEVVLVVDTSGSMAGAPLDAAKAAATSFVRQLPPATRVAVVGFGTAPYVVSPMTDDAAALAAAIAGLRAGGETALYDALNTAAAQFSLEEVPRSLVLVTDGGDTTSRASLDDATARLVAGHVRLFGLRLRTKESNDGVLDQLAAATKGRTVDAVDAASLTGTYADIAASAVQQVRLTFTAHGHGATPVTVQLTGGGVTHRSSVTLPFPAERTVESVAPAPNTATATSASGDDSGSRLPLALGAGAMFLALLVLAHLVLVRPPRSVLAANRRTRRASTLRDAKGRFGAAMERTLERRGRRDGLRTKLELAGIALRPGEYVVAAGTGTVAGAVLGLALGGIGLAFVSGLLVVSIAWLLLGMRTTKRRSRLEQQLPVVLQQLTSGLRAGYGIMQALDAVSRDVASPMGDELRRVVHEVQLGRPLTESLDGMAQRVGGSDFAWVVQAIEINHDVGGDLVEVLDAVASTIRARAHLRREIKTLSAQGRLSARVLLAMPFAMAVLLSLIQPGYLAPFAHKAAGPYLLGAGGVMMLVGWLWLRRIVRLRF